MIRGFEIHAPHEILFWDRKTGVASVFLFVVGAQFHPNEMQSSGHKPLLKYLPAGKSAKTGSFQCA
jgi:hypothetical protein